MCTCRVVNYDEFTRRLVEIYNEVDESKQVGSVCLKN